VEPVVSHEDVVESRDAAVSPSATYRCRSALCFGETLGRFRGCAITHTRIGLTGESLRFNAPHGDGVKLGAVVVGGEARGWAVRQPRDPVNGMVSVGRGPVRASDGAMLEEEIELA